jgi:hypothetical protein
MMKIEYSCAITAYRCDERASEKERKRERERERERERGGGGVLFLINIETNWKRWIKSANKFSACVGFEPATPGLGDGHIKPFCHPWRQKESVAIAKPIRSCRYNALICHLRAQGLYIEILEKIRVGL